MLEALILNQPVIEIVSPASDLTGANTTTPPRKPPKPTRWARPVNGGSCPQNLKQVCLELAKTTPPKELCERRGGHWDPDTGCYIPQPNKPPSGTRATGTRWQAATVEQVRDCHNYANSIGGTVVSYDPCKVRVGGKTLDRDGNQIAGNSHLSNALAFKPKRGRGVLNESTAGGSRRPKNQAVYLFSPIS